MKNQINKIIIGLSLFSAAALAQGAIYDDFSSGYFTGENGKWTAIYDPGWGAKWEINDGTLTFSAASTSAVTLQYKSNKTDFSTVASTENPLRVWVDVPANPFTRTSATASYEYFAFGLQDANGQKLQGLVHWRTPGEGSDALIQLAVEGSTTQSVWLPTLHSFASGDKLALEFDGSTASFLHYDSDWNSIRSLTSSITGSTFTFENNEAALFMDYASRAMTQPNDGRASITAIGVIPEPATSAFLLGAAALGLLAIRRIRRK